MRSIYGSHKFRGVERVCGTSVDVYELTKHFPKEELYALTSQLRRSAISIPSNIAEGCARNKNGETIHFLYIALGSLAELETQLIIASKLGLLDSSNNIFKKVIFVKQLTIGLIKYLKNVWSFNF